MDEKGNESSHLMLITPERVFYAGLLGRPRQRGSGAFHVYVAIEGGLRLSSKAALRVTANWPWCCRTCGTPSPATVAR